VDERCCILGSNATTCSASPCGTGGQLCHFDTDCSAPTMCRAHGFANYYGLCK
jgi:hypothetical protein